jgi:isocitrate dehydrogenase
MEKIMQSQQKSFAQDKKNSEHNVPIAVAYGDGIGPEIMRATLRILNAAGAKIAPEEIYLGEQIYLAGETSGITDESWKTIERNKIILKAPITTPQGKGYKSLNVTLRKSLGLFANVRPVQGLDPFIVSGHPEMNMVIIRENEEDLYAGIEHQQTQDVVQCLKLITRPGSEKIIRYAFEFAKVYGRKKVTCLVKDNIMKLTDGLFHQIFREIAVEYPDIQSEVQIIDIGSARIAAKPEKYDVIVTSNLYGDIVSDIAAEISGSVGLAGSANIGKEVAMFEAIHGSAPDIAGQNIANPSGLINAAVMMLAHIGQTDVADRVKNAWLTTIEEGFHTADIYNESISTRRVSTEEFADEVIQRLGLKPQKLIPSKLSEGEGSITIPEYQRPNEKKTLVGVDVFIDWNGSDPNVIGNALSGLAVDGIKLKMITNRGVKVYPKGQSFTFCTDHWRCRFISDEPAAHITNGSYHEITFERLLHLLSELHQAGYDIIKTENLYAFGERRGFSLGQGE